MASITSVALAGCVQEDIANPKERAKQKIAFDSPVLYSNVNTRANVYGEIENYQYGTNLIYFYPREEKFVIFAVSHDGDFAGWESATEAAFNGDAISYDSSIDGWAPRTADSKYYYWDKTKKMSFAAMSPADLEQENWTEQKFSYGPRGLIVTDFEVNNNASNHFDLLYSTRICNQVSTNMGHDASYYSGIPIQFQHALSSIRFSISNKSVEDIVLTGIELNGVKYKGTFTENITEDSSDYSRYENGENGNVKPVWEVAEDVLPAPYEAFRGSIKFPEEAQYVANLVMSANDPSNVCNQLLVMPQELTDNVFLTVHYTVNGSPASKDISLKGQMSGKDNVADVDKIAINAWEMGKRYTYRLFYSPASADKDKIYFAPRTDNWQDVDVIILSL